MLLEARLWVRDQRRLALFPLLVRATARHAVASLAFSPQVRQSFAALLLQSLAAEKQLRHWSVYRQSAENGTLGYRLLRSAEPHAGIRDQHHSTRRQILQTMLPLTEWVTAPGAVWSLARASESAGFWSEAGPGSTKRTLDAQATGVYTGDNQSTWATDMGKTSLADMDPIRGQINWQSGGQGERAAVGLGLVTKAGDTIARVSRGAHLTASHVFSSRRESKRSSSLAAFPGVTRLSLAQQRILTLSEFWAGFRHNTWLPEIMAILNTRRQAELSSNYESLRTVIRKVSAPVFGTRQQVGERPSDPAARLADILQATWRSLVWEITSVDALAGERSLRAVGEFGELSSFVRERLHSHKETWTQFAERLQAFALRKDLARSSVTVPIRQGFRYQEQRTGERFVRYPGLPPLPLSAFTYWSGLERPARLGSDFVTFPPDALWGDIWHFYQEGYDRLQLPEKDFPYNPVGVFDPITGEVADPGSDPHAPDVLIPRPIRHPWLQWQDWAVRELEVDLGALVTIMLGLRTFWLNFARQLAAMSAYPALTLALEYLAAAVERNGNEELRRAFRQARWYAEAVVMRRCQFLLRRRYDPWLAVSPFGVPYENQGFWVQEGGVLTAPGPATLRFVLRTWVDGCLRGSVVVPGGTAEVLLDSIPVASFTTSQTGFLVPVLAGSHELMLIANPENGTIVFSGVMVDGVRFMGAEMDFVSEEEDGVAAISDLLAMLMQYYESHHRDKVKGTRKLWN